MTTRAEYLIEQNNQGLLTGREKQMFDIAVERGLIKPPQVDTETTESEDKGGMTAAFGAGVDKVQELGYRAVKGFTDVGAPEEEQTNVVGRAIGQGGSLSKWAQEGIDRNIDEQKDYEPTVGSYKDVDSINDAGSYVGEMVAGSLPYMAAAVSGVGAFGMAGGLSEEAYDKQPETEKNAARAVASGAGQMALERLGIRGSMGQIGKDILKDGVLKTAQRYGKGDLVDAVKDPNVARRLLKGATWEGMTETGQEALAQWGAGASLDQIHGLDEAFVGGFVVGGTVRSGAESAQRIITWQQKAGEVAENGINALVEQGIPQDQAIEQVRAQIIESAIKQGQSEAVAAGTAARMMKERYGIDHEIFTPVANDVAEQRRVWEENRDQKMQANRQRSEQMRVKHETQDLDDALNGDSAPTVDDLLGDAGNIQGPLPSEQVATEIVEDAPLSVSERRELMNLRLEKQRVEGGVGSIQDKLSEKSAPTATDLIGEAGYVQGPVPSEQYANVQNTVVDPFNGEQSIKPTEESAAVPPTVAERRQALNDKLEKQRVEGGIGDAQQKLAGDTAPTVSYLLGDAGRVKDPDEITDYNNSDDSILAPPDIPIIKSNEDNKAPSIEGVVVSEGELPIDLAENSIGKVEAPVPSLETNNKIDIAAHEAATSPTNDQAEPSQAQKDAGNYKMGRIEHSGFKIGIENPQGSTRSGQDKGGKDWSVTMKSHYGDITGTKGADGDALDVFVKPSTEHSDKVFVIDQIEPSNGKFDEHKIMMGYDSKKEAQEAYLANYGKDWQGIGNITESPISEFKDWVKNGETTKPFTVTPQPGSNQAKIDNLSSSLETKQADNSVVSYKREVASTVIRTGNKPIKGISLVEAKTIAKEFMDEYNGNIKLAPIVIKNQEDIYGSEGTAEKFGVLKGAYHGEQGVFTLTASNLSNRADARETLRHEILGHYGLDTFKKADKQAVIDKIIASENEPNLKVIWGKIKADSHYKTLTPELQAEEVFAHIIENHRNGFQRIYDRIIAWLKQAMRKAGLNKYPSSVSELHRLAETISKQIKQGKQGRAQSLGSSSKTPEQKKESTMLRRATENSSIADEEKYSKDYFIRRVQDKFQRLLVIQRSLAVNEDNDAYMAEEAFHGKVSEDLRKLELERTDKIANTMAKHQLSQDEVDLYLIAKHAKERNAYIDTINPELKGEGSGMSNEQAQSILDKAIFEEKYPALEAVSDLVYSMLKQNRKMMVEFGLEAQDAIDNWQSQYKFYVPLKGYAKDEETHAKDDNGKQVTRYGAGKGFNIKGRETIKAMGRRSLAESPLLHSIQDTTQAIIRARKNEVGNTFLKLVNDNPDSDLWEVFTAQKPDITRGEITKDGKATIGPVKMTAMAMKNSDDYFKVKVDGVESYIKIKDVVLKDTMANLGVDEMGAFVRNIGKVTRTLSALVTTWNPEFMLTNFTRDVQAAVANVLAETQVADGKALNTENLARKMVGSMPKAMVVLRQGFRNNKFDGSGKFNDPKWSNYLKEFLESGAKTGWVNQKDVKELASELKSSISRASKTKAGKVRRLGKNVADFVSDYNDIVENSARFSVYYHAREQGISVKQASSLAKNLTINFNRKGEMGATMNALYMFSNASVQGTANMLRALGTPKDRSKSMWDPKFYNLSQKLAVGSIFGTIAMAQVMREMGGDDEDGIAFYDKVPDYVKATNYVIMTGGKDYIAIPMPYGYNFLAGLGHSLDGLIQGESVGRQATKIALSAVGTFSPLGITESENTAVSMVKMAAPTVIKPFVEMAVDEKFTGGNIYPDQRGYNVKKADANRGGKHTWEWSKNFTSWLNEASGGTEYKSGGMDIAPQSIDHMVKFMGGGVLQFGLRWQNLAAKAMAGKEIESRDIPFWRRFHKQLNPKQTIGEFYDVKESLAAYKADLNYMRGADRANYLSKYRNHLMLNNYASGIDKQLRALNKRKRGIEASRLSDNEKEISLQRIEDLKIDHTMRFAKKRHQLGVKYL